MIHYNRLGYEIKRDLTKFSLNISKELKRPQRKFVHQMLYGILAGNKVHLSEIARALKENITLKKTIDRLFLITPLAAYSTAATTFFTSLSLNPKSAAISLAEHRYQ